MLSSGDRAGNNAFNPRTSDNVELSTEKSEFIIFFHPPF